MTTENWDAGQHCWLDLMTSDLAAAKAFYSELLGWGFKETPMPDDSGGVYTMATLSDGEVGGVNELMPDQRKQGVPPSWSLYTAVDSVDETYARVKEAGGKAIAEPFDIPNTGRMAVLAGPEGEAFSIWQATSDHAGAGRFDGAPGSFCWGELGSKNPDKSKAFYSSIFPWSAQTQKMGETEYTMFNIGEAPAAGMYKMPPEMDRVPAHWLAYFTVADIEASTTRAKELGAEQVCPATKAEGVGTFTILSDPQGANFGIIQLDAPA